MSAQAVRSREFRLRARPEAEATAAHFDYVGTELAPPSVGQVLIRNTWMTVDPYMRGRMDDAPSYIAPFSVGAALEGGAIGEVIASADSQIPVGMLVSHFAGWRSHALLNAAAVTPIDTGMAAPQHYLGALGTTGLTAYVALTETAPVQKGDSVFISAAAGAVGSIAGQLARRFGAGRVIGSAGGREKAERAVEQFGYDSVIDYKQGNVPDQLARLAPEGIDVYIDLVGGSHLEAAIDSLRVGGRIALVGAISNGYKSRQSCGPRNLPHAITNRLTLRGMIVSDHFDRFAEYIPQAAAWLTDGTLRAEYTVVDGLENAPEAFLSLFRGANTGKLLVRLDGDSA